MIAEHLGNLRFVCSKMCHLSDAAYGIILPFKSSACTGKVRVLMGVLIDHWSRTESYSMIKVWWSSRLWAMWCRMALFTYGGGRTVVD
jgi:hypothetical protein